MQSKYKIFTSGQLGNCLFRLASAVKFYGKENISTVILHDTLLNDKKYENTIKLLQTVAPWVKVCDYIDALDPLLVIEHRLSYWQSLGVIPSRSECRDLFTITPEVTDEPVIHIRGTDFKKVPGNVLSNSEFIRKASDKLGCNISDFIVCTDDREFAKSLGFAENQLSKRDDLGDFNLIAGAKKLVMCPSTFSWWAGFLGEHDIALWPSGFGIWDSGLLRADSYSANSNKELCWEEECEMI